MAKLSRLTYIQLQLRTALIAAFAIAVLAGCGRETTVYPYEGGDGLVSIYPIPNAPRGFLDQSVNRAYLSLDRPEATAGSQQLVVKLKTLAGTNAPGAFYDATAVGNRAVLATSKYDLKALSLFSLDIDATSNTNTRAHLSVMIDLNCDQSLPIRTLVTDDFASAVRTTDSIWSVAGQEIQDGAGATLVPATSSADRASLQALLSEYPNACLRGDRSDARESLNDTPMASLQISIGGADTTTATDLTIKELKINGDIYADWSL